MNQHNQMWTAQDVQTLRAMSNNNCDDKDIAKALGRTKAAIQFKRYSLKTDKPKVARKPSAKYTRYEKSQTEVSLLWGLLKFKKG